MWFQLQKINVYTSSSDARYIDLKYEITRPVGKRWPMVMKMHVSHNFTSTMDNGLVFSDSGIWHIQSSPRLNLRSAFSLFSHVICVQPISLHDVEADCDRHPKFSSLIYLMTNDITMSSLSLLDLLMSGHCNFRCLIIKSPDLIFLQFHTISSCVSNLLQSALCLFFFALAFVLCFFRHLQYGSQTEHGPWDKVHVHLPTLSFQSRWCPFPLNCLSPQ